MIKHIIRTAFCYSDKLELSKKTELLKRFVVPSLQAQANQNFVWNLWHNVEDVEYLKKEIDYPFVNTITPTPDERPHCFYETPEDFVVKEYEKYLYANNINIQTKLDSDDSIDADYVETIQTIYEQNKDKYKTFIIHFKPIMVHSGSNKKYKMNFWNATDISNHFSLCAKNYSGVYIGKQSHNLMYKYVEKVFTLDGKCQYNIHGSNPFGMRYFPKLIKCCPEI